MKKILAMMVLGSCLLSTSVVLAAPVEFSGDVSTAYKRNTYNNGDPDESSAIYTLKIMAKLNLGDGWSAYTRLGAQQTGRPDSFADFNTDVYSGKKSVAALDQFGFIYEKDKLAYKIGRQDVTVGTTALLYSRSDTNIGRRNFVDGLTINGKVGAVDLFVLAAKEDDLNDTNNGVYAVRTGYNLTPDLNVGLTLARFAGDGVDSSNHWALDSAYTYKKSTWTAEYTKSSLNGSNKAYAATWNYDFDGKTSLGLTGFRVEDNGSMNQESDFDAGKRGIHYTVSHALKDNLSLEVVYKDQKAIATGEKDTALEATLTYSF